MPYEQLAKRAGPFGMIASVGIWMTSVPVLGFVMQANQAAWRGDPYRVAQSSGNLRLFHATAVLWGLVFVLQQLAAPLLLSFTLRALYRWRSAVCFTIGWGWFILLDGLGLLGMLVWLRFRLGAG